MTKSLLCFAALAGLMSGPSVTRAQAIAWDGAEGADLGALNGVTSGGGWAAGWTAQDFLTVVEVNTELTPALYYAKGSVQVWGGTRAFQIGNGGALVNSAFSRAIPTVQTSTVYFSVLLRQVAGHDIGSTVSDFVQIALSEDADVDNSGGFITAASGDSYAMRARTRTDSGDTNTDTGIFFEPDTTYLLVGRLSKSPDNPGQNYNRFTLYINPTSLVESENTGFSSSASISIPGLDTIVGRTARLDDGDRILFDEIRIGDSFAAVVPEPGGALALLGGASLLAVRRRRA